MGEWSYTFTLTTSQVAGDRAGDADVEMHRTREPQKGQPRPRKARRVLAVNRQRFLTPD